MERQHGGLSARVAGSMDSLVKTVAGYEVLAVTGGDPDLEDVFVAFYDQGEGGAG